MADAPLISLPMPYSAYVVTRENLTQGSRYLGFVVFVLLSSEESATLDKNEKASPVRYVPYDINKFVP